MLRYHSGEPIAQIARAVGITRKNVGKWVSKALAVGSSAALKDAYHRPKEPSITEEAKAWVVHLACAKPKDLGYAPEVWTRSALARQVRECAVEAAMDHWSAPPKPRCTEFSPSNHCIPKR